MPKERQQSWWNPTFAWFGSKERNKFMQYQAQGGGLGMNAWLRAGKPSFEGILTPTTQAIMATPEFESQNIWRQAASKFGAAGAGRAPVVTPQTPLDEDKKLLPNQFKTYEEALKAAPEGFEPELTEMGYWSFRRVPMKAKADMPEGFYKTYKDAATAAPEGYVPLQTSGGWWTIQRDPDYFERKRKETPYGTSPWDITETEEIEGYWNPETGRWEEPPGWMSPAEQARLDLQKQQFDADERYRQWEQKEADRRYRSQLMANPMSWLQYSAYTGEQAGIQPWMLPLMSGQYQAGQAIPGFQTGQGEGKPMSSLPELRTPSAQYFARMGPTGQQQWLGYQQARTGATPEESQFRLRSGAPPSGRFRGLRWMR